MDNLLGGADARVVAGAVAKAVGGVAYAQSFSTAAGLSAILVKAPASPAKCGRRIVVIGPRDKVHAAGFAGEGASCNVDGRDVSLAVCAATHENVKALQGLFPHLAPRCFGLATSAGLGDRLGIATPGLLRAVRGARVVPFVAQQSIREMTRTERTAVEVMDDAVLGVFEAGWRDGFGSDADHLKTAVDIDVCAAAGFTMFTIDPGAHVDNSADTAGAGELRRKFEAVDWPALDTTSADAAKRYLSKPILLDGDFRLSPDESTLMRAAVKYGAAVRHTAAMYRHLASKHSSRPFELEMSVDETATPTSTFEHYFVASELKRLGVKWVSLAPRFVGDFEKGIDYKGDLAAFRASFAEQAAVMRTLGPYKISIHSGSDKFSIYPTIAELAGPYVHLKTAGTSYLEALGVLARAEPALFREILGFAFARYDTDRASYHVSADVTKVPHPADAKDSDLPSVLDGNDGRQLLHVTFGSVLTTRGADGKYLFRDRLVAAICAHEEKYYAALERHLGRHVRPFARK